MDYQPGPDPGMAGIPYNSPAPPIPEPYNHSRALMVILTILSLAKVAIPNLGAYHPLAVGLLYLTCSAPFLYWALITRYLDGLSSPLMPWYMMAPGLDTYCVYRHIKGQPTTVVESNNPSSSAQIQTVMVSRSNSNLTTNGAFPNIQKMNLADVRKGLVLLGHISKPSLLNTAMKPTKS
ncbi:hypothetical protein DSO57_1012234 [Entomophthora muscae]|uniref:Uncharacterized protein n=1 Tax=Entomophthora muscae TaxID=34485 RepID=A0ACC2RL39_9FUNG|nr:hypothetical protein DSO57_1012234 [Entomophthora muscae]